MKNRLGGEAALCTSSSGLVVCVLALFALFASESAIVFEEKVNLLNLPVHLPLYPKPNPIKPCFLLRKKKNFCGRE